MLLTEQNQPASLCIFPSKSREGGLWCRVTVCSLASDCQDTFPLRAATLILGPHMMWTEKLQTGNLAWLIRPAGASDKETHISKPTEIYHFETAGELTYGWNLPSPKSSFWPINCPSPLCRICTQSPHEGPSLFWLKNYTFLELPIALFFKSRPSIPSNIWELLAYIWKCFLFFYHFFLNIFTYYYV